jgi:hypothetical protein
VKLLPDLKVEGKKGRKLYNLFEVVKHKNLTNRCEKQEKSDILISLSRLLVSGFKQKAVKEEIVSAFQNHANFYNCSDNLVSSMLLIKERLENLGV